MSDEVLTRVERYFRALGDVSRVRLLLILAEKEYCVSELVSILGDKISTVSQRLRLLRSEGLVERRREGTHLYYRLSDHHVLEMLTNAIAHAEEGNGSSSEGASETE